MNINEQLINASINGNTQEAKLLLDRGANIHADDDYPLRLASENGHTDIVKLLEEYIYKEKFQKEINTTIIEIIEKEINIIENFNLEEINCDKEISELKGLFNE